MEAKAETRETVLVPLPLEQLIWFDFGELCRAPRTGLLKLLDLVALHGAWCVRARSFSCARCA